MVDGKQVSVRQEQIYNYIVQFIDERGYSPAIRDIQHELRISSTSVVAYNLKVLEERGMITRDDKISRGISIPPVLGMHARSVINIPLLGVITAGQGLPDPEEVDISTAERIGIPADILPIERVKDVFALKVRGTSMIDALIGDGDIVLLRRQETADNGQTVAALLVQENAVTLKRFFNEGKRIRLQPANPLMEPIYSTPENVRIQGLVVGVVRSLV
jgi:repressor LexA